ncbi:MAG TPA: murein biosynthesis integral membrane protein MurJ [Propionibacteriaceae bacterium]|nr:murein biosynthesis integral membrane protein MurJ [Propionibacteriaceae bacterium]
MTAPQSADQSVASPTDGGEGHGRRLINATAVMASGTMISRILGLVRAMMIAFILGNGTMQAGVLSLALTVPSSLYLLLAGGTLNNVLVPQIVRAVTHDDDGGKAFVDRIMTGFLIILGALTVIFTIGAPIVMSIYTSATWRTPDMADQWRSLLLMSYITMPQVFFYGVFFLIGQVLNAREKFGPMMWAPIANNVVAILSLGVYLAMWGVQTSSGNTFTDQQVWLLGIGSTLGIVTQTLILIPYLRRVGFRYRPRFDLRGTGLGRTFRVARWMVGFVALTSLAQVVVTNLASGGTTATGDIGGAWNAYQSAYLIWILPHSLLTVSLATAMMPTASKFAQADNMDDVAAETGRALRLALTFLVPSSVAFVALASPITRVPFGNGAGASDYHYVAWALMAFGLGLIPFTVQYLYLRAFYSLDNTKTPFLLQIWISGANALLAVALAFISTDAATLAARLALAYSLSYFVGVFLTHRALRKRLPALNGRRVLGHIGRLLLASAPAAAAAWVITWLASGWSSPWLRLAALVVAGLVAVLLFFFAAKRLSIPEAASLLNILRRRKADDGVSDAVEAIIEETEELQPEADGENPEVQLNTDPDGAGVFIPVAEPLSYPDPDTGAIPGQLLGERYELIEQLAAGRSNNTWRARDTVLGRPVLMILLHSSPAHTQRVLEAARAAAVATDARFLRVLDVVADTDGAEPYLVYEYEPGLTLEKALQAGPLPAAEASWLIREAADALAPLHAEGHFHGRLTPSNVLITPSGHLKILGFGVDAARQETLRRTSITAATDVLALGDLLYAALVVHWPLGRRYGLPAAPVDHGRAVPPRQVLADVPESLNELVERLRSGVGHSNAVTTAEGLVTALNQQLGKESLAAALRTRFQGGAAEYGEPSIAEDQSAPPIPASAANHTLVRTMLDEEDAAPEFVSEALDHGDQFTPVPPPPGRGAGEHWRRVPLLLVVSLVVAAVGIVCAGVLTWQARAVAQPLSAHNITKVQDFDPKADGGSGGENSRKVRLAVDGNPETAWRTEKYAAATIPDRPGVGLMIDLGMAEEVSSVQLTLVGSGTTVQVLLPKDPNHSASTKSVKDWTPIAEASGAATTAEIVLPEQTTTRYLLVYLTELPDSGGGKYQGGIAELSVLGH